MRISKESFDFLAENSLISGNNNTKKKLAENSLIRGNNNTKTD